MDTNVKQSGESVSAGEITAVLATPHEHHGHNQHR